MLLQAAIPTLLNSRDFLEMPMNVVQVLSFQSFATKYAIEEAALVG